jgi:hypothetical protein
VPRERAFRRAIVSDQDSGGWLDGLFAENIRYALEEKIDKTKKISADFKRWILLLVDTIMPGREWADEVEPIVLDLAHFNGVAVLDVTDGSLRLEWPTNSLIFEP